MTTKPNITILDGDAANPGDLSWDALRQLGNVTIYPITSDEQKILRAKDADIILTNKVLLDRPTLQQLPRLKYIGVQATGYNVVDLPAAREQGIIVTNVPAYSTDSVAQHTISLLLAATNQVQHYAHATRQGIWAAKPAFCYWDTNLIELASKTFAIIGFGNIGRKVASIAHALGMNVIAQTSKPQQQLPEYVTKVTRDELLSQADVISIHCPLTDATLHTVDVQTIRQMKPTAIVINTGRGPLVDEVAMAQALHEGRLAAYCADVMEQEPPSAHNPLLREPTAFLTPHIAWATREARQRLLNVVTNNVRAFLDGHPQNVVS